MAQSVHTSGVVTPCELLALRTLVLTPLDQGQVGGFGNGMTLSCGSTPYRKQCHVT